MYRNKKRTRVLVSNSYENILKSKRSVSIIIGYVLLVVIAISLALMVYVWLKNYIPGVSEECPDSASLMIADYSCSDNNISIKLRNTGLFSIYGFIARIREQENGFFYELKTGESIENYFGISPYEKGLKPNDEENVLLSFAPYARILELQVQPFVLGEKNKPVLCENIITQRIQNCEGSGSSEINLGQDNILANIKYTDLRCNGGEDCAGSQIKFNIADIPSGSTIESGEICLYISLVNTPDCTYFPPCTIMDNDLRVWYINDETWTESISASELNSQILLSETNVALSSIAIDTWSCFDVTAQLRQSYSNNNQYFTLRFVDPDWNAIIHDSDSVTGPWNFELKIGGDRAYLPHIVFNNRIATSNNPYLKITYT